MRRLNFGLETSETVKCNISQSHYKYIDTINVNLYTGKLRSILEPHISVPWIALLPKACEGAF